MLGKALVMVPILLLLVFAASADAKPKDKGDKPGKKGAPVSAPEFDSRTSGAALALLVGGALVLSETRRRRSLTP